MLLAVACRTVKVNEHLKTSIDSTVNNNIKQSSTIHSEIVDNSKEVNNSNLSDTTHKVVTETYYDKPDSTGNQAITKIVTTETNTGKKLNQLTLKENNITKKADSTGNKVDKSKINKEASKDHDKQTTTKKKTPLWVWLSCAIISLGLVLLGYFVLKRFYLVK